MIFTVMQRLPILFRRFSRTSLLAENGLIFQNLPLMILRVIWGILSIPVSTASTGIWARISPVSSKIVLLSKSDFPQFWIHSL